MASRKRRLREAMAFRMLLVAYHKSMQRSEPEPKPEPKPDSYEDYTDEYTELCNLYKDWADASLPNGFYDFWDLEGLEYWQYRERDTMAQSLMGRLYPDYVVWDGDSELPEYDQNKWLYWDFYERELRRDEQGPVDPSIYSLTQNWRRDRPHEEEEEWNSWWFK